MSKFFTFASCNTCMSFANRHAHLVNKYYLHIFLVDHVAHKDLYLGAFMDLIAAERLVLNKKTAAGTNEGIQI